MALLVNGSCIKCKFTDCVEHCPVDCFYEGETMLVIHPDQCIDCGLCEPACPVSAIVPDSYPDHELWQDINRRYSLLWPKITTAKKPLDEAERFRNMADKFPAHFSPAPAPASSDAAIGRRRWAPRTGVRK